MIRGGYSVLKRLVKLPSFQCFPLQLSGYQYIPSLSFLLRHQLWYISARLVGKCISLERHNILNTDLQSILQNINKFAAGQANTILTNTRSICSCEFCREFCEIFWTTYFVNKCSKTSRKIHGKTPVLKSLFNKAAGLRLTTILKRHFSIGVFLWIFQGL